MNSSDAPSRIIKAFGVNGLKNTIPVDSSTSTDNNGVATFDKGFPPVTMQPLSAGGIPPSGKDVNGVLYSVTLQQQWQNAGMGYTYSADFSSAIAGYPKGALLNNTMQTGKWLNTVELNQSNPESSVASSNGWVPAFDYGVANVVLGPANFSLSSLQASKDRIILTGALTSNISLTFPSWMKSWTVINNCSGSFSVICKTLLGTGISVQAAGGIEKIYCDGVNILRDFGNSSQRNVGSGSKDIPDMSYFMSDKSSAGYQVLPGGLIIQWSGRINMPQTTSTVMSKYNWTFPIPFQNACLQVMTSMSGNTTYVPSAFPVCSSSTPTLTGVELGSGYTASASSINALAIGY